MRTRSSPTNAFDPAAPGTAERRWRELLRGAPRWAPTDGPLVVVAPHPDDETLGAGGLIAARAAEGAPVTVISVTDGEAAPVRIPELAAVRRRELGEALDLLGGGRVAIRRLGLPDGEVTAHATVLADAIDAATPDAATVVAPIEGDGHPDHDAVARAARRVAGRRRLALARYPIWAWHHARPSAFAGARLRRFVLSRRQRLAKRRAVERHRSQLAPPDDAPVVPRHVLPYFLRPFEVFLR